MKGLGQQGDIEAKAAEWVVRLGGGPLGDRERRALDRWLAESPAHATAFAYARSTWGELAALKAAPGALFADVAALRGQDAPPARHGFPGWRVASPMMLHATALAAVLLVSAGLGAFWFGNPLVMLAADYRTSPGESRTVTLADGSLIQLDTASALAVHFDGHERRVVLLAGEAYFTVAPMRGSETRPFVVMAANGTARALGTQFMVGRQNQMTEVTVTEHQVQVAAAGPNADKPGIVVLSPGQSVRYDRASGLGAVAETDLARATAWRRGRLIFDKVRLADVVADLNRYRRGRIVIADSSLGDRRVSGVFETADPAGALAAITRELGLRAASVPPFVTLLY
ncbi:MAG: FecR family protein [Acetobacteraceae bacterium]